MNYPSVLYPTILEGEIYGPVRCESLDGGELFLPADPSGVTRFKNFQPFVRDGKTWGVTHLQFLSPRGWIKTDPDCYHWWRMPHLKLRDSNGNWIPGSEFGLYFRKPFSWRWDVAGTFLDGALRHFVRTKGFFGAHFD